jgi:1-deoxy-D-xylulose-5-phosphate reductoisomerase
VDAGREGGTAPAVFNAANEVAVAAFLDGEIRFGQIADLIRGVLDTRRPGPVADLESVLAADHDARSRARDLMQRMSS